jgi:alkaline phosphatase D
MSRSPSLDDWLRIELSRRTLLAGGLALCGLPARLLGRSEPGLSDAFRTFSPFKLGVASGDPTPTGVVLWTRLAPDPMEGGGMPPVPVDVQWEVAEDDKMKQVVQRGVVRAVPEWAHSVHVEVARLRPDRWYWYRFSVGDSASAIGRTRTLPPLGAPANRLRFAFAIWPARISISCFTSATTFTRTPAIRTPGGSACTATRNS